MTTNTNPSTQPVSDGELEKQVDEVKRALIIPLKEYEVLSNIVFTDFHGQEEGADPKFDKNYKRYQEADKKLWQAIKNLLAQSYQSGYAAAVGDAVEAIKDEPIKDTYNEHSEEIAFYRNLARKGVREAIEDLDPTKQISKGEDG